MSQRRKEIVFVEANRTGSGRDSLDRSKERFSARPHLLTRAPESYPDGYLDEAEVTVVDTTDRAAVKRVCEAIDPVAVWSSSDMGIEVAADVAAQLGLIGPDPTAVRLCRDKGRQHHAMRATGVPVPTTVTIDSHVPAGAMDRLNPPFVVKPARGTGSMHVRSFVDEGEAVAYAEHLLPAHDRVLIQELVEGLEFSVELLGGRPFAVMRKHLSTGDTFVETGHDCCGAGDSAASRDLVAVAVSAAHSLRLTAGPVHVELRRGPDGPLLIEVNPRLAGGQIPAVVREALGVDPVSETLRWLFGGKPRLHPIRERGAAIRFLLADRRGRLAEVRGMEAARNLDGVVEVTAAPPGWPVHPGDYRQRVAHLIAVGDDGAAAGRLADEGVALLSAEVRP